MNVDREEKCVEDRGTLTGKIGKYINSSHYIVRGFNPLQLKHSKLPKTPVLRSAKRAPANVRRLNNRK